MNALAKMTVVEAKMFPRDPGAVAFGVLFPTILLLGLGAIPMLREPSEDFGGIRFVEFWAPSALVVGMVAIGAQHVPILIATYRERGILRRMSTTPVHPGYLLIAQMIVALVSVAASALLLVLSASAATSVGTLIFMALMLFGGAFLPRFLMPDVLVTIGEYVPPGVQAMLAAWFPEAAEVTAAGSPRWVQLGILLGTTVVAGAIAARVFRWK